MCKVYLIINFKNLVIMEEKNFIIERIKKSSEKSMYIFFNVQKGIGIKRMRPLFGDSSIQVGTEVLINGEKHVLTTIFNFKQGEMIVLIKGEMIEHIYI